MNTKQQDAWEDLVQQCKTQITERPYYSSINVASQVRSDAIVAAGELVELVTPELAALLDGLVALAESADVHVPALLRGPMLRTIDEARELATRIKGALGDSQA